MSNLKPDLRSETEYRELIQTLRSMERVLIAFSGGVDSTQLLQVAKETLKI